MAARAVDIAVIGGGAFGLWCGLSAAAAGAEAVVLEAGDAAFAGASATPVGALTPFPFARPDDPLATFQAQALMAMPDTIARIEGLAACTAGYRVLGRLTPLADAAARERAGAQVAEGARRMPQAPGGGPAGWALCDAVEHGALFAPEAAASGWLVDGVSAQVDTVAYGEALSLAAAAMPGLTVETGWPVTEIAGTGAHWRVSGSAGDVLARQVIIAAGWQAGGLAALTGGGEAAGPAARADRPVKGQAARLAQAPGLMPETLPAVQAPGVFIVHHGRGVIGVGATSEAGETALTTDDGLDGVLERARALMPVLGRAVVTARWAGIRPRPPGRLPRIGPVIDRPGLWHASGGFKIGLALAHQAGMGLAAAALGLEPGAALGRLGPAPALPAAFAPGGVAAET